MTVQGIASSDFAALSELRAKASQDANNALPEVAQQFEGIFLQSMLKSMRMGEHFLDESSPFRGRDSETFQDMLDAQYASNIAQGRGIGLAAMLAKQLSISPVTEQAATNTLSRNNDSSSFASTSLQQDSELRQTGLIHDVDQFIKSIWPQAKQAASLLGLDPKVLMAQTALETGWGKFIAKDEQGASSNNLFNIKSLNGSGTETVNVKTTEYIADTPIKVNAAFKKYSSIEQSFNDYVSLIKETERYQGALANTANPEAYVSELHKAGYATDPEYSSKILSIYHGNELNQAMQRCGLSEQT